MRAPSRASFMLRASVQVLQATVHALRSAMAIDHNHGRGDVEWEATSAGARQIIHELYS